MGLKYEYFLLPIQAETFYKAMLKANGIDETQFLLEENKQWDEYSNYFMKFWNKEEGYSMDGIEKIHENHRTPEMESYKKRTKSTIQIYFMECPVKQEWTYCIAENVPLWIKEHFTIHGYYIHKFLKIMSFVLFATYHSGSDGGSICKYTQGKEINPQSQIYKIPGWFEYNFVGYIKRLKNINPYPFWDMHNWMENKPFYTYWQYHVRFDYKKDIKKIVEEIQRCRDKNEIKTVF